MPGGAPLPSALFARSLRSRELSWRDVERRGRRCERAMDDSDGVAGVWPVPGG